MDEIFKCRHFGQETTWFFLLLLFPLPLTHIYKTFSCFPLPNVSDANIFLSSVCLVDLSVLLLLNMTPHPKHFSVQWPADDMFGNYDADVLNVGGILIHCISY